MTAYRLSDRLDDQAVVLAFYAFDFHPSSTREMCDRHDREWFSIDEGVTSLASRPTGCSATAPSRPSTASTSR